MGYFCIKGTFRIIGTSLDGDSVKFIADNVNNWDKIKGPVKLTKELKKAQLRFEAIDTLELHYPILPEKFHQPLHFANLARDCVLSQLGFKNVEWKPPGEWAESQKVEKADDTTGFILTKGVDNEQYKRPVSFVFFGNTDIVDGTEITPDKDLIKKSVNYKLVEEGLAYPTYYLTLESKLRTIFTKAVTTARKNDKGLWNEDKTNIGIGFDYDSIFNDDIVMPKIYRRILEHLKKGGNIENFHEFLIKEKKDKLKIKGSNQIKRLADRIDYFEGQIKLKDKPENIIFQGT